jgi:hypothetical protein
MKTIHLLLLSLGLSWALIPTAFGQEVTITEGGTDWTLGANDFNTDADGVSTLSESSPNYVDNLATVSSAIIPAQLGLSGGGWVFNGSEGTVVIANNDATPSVVLADPFVAYSYYFVNTAGSTQPFSMQFTTSFPDLSFAASDPAQVKASFGVSLTDGSPGPGPTSSSAAVSQTAVLGEAASMGGPLIQSTSADVDLGPADEYVTNGGTTTTNLSTAGFPSYNPGPSGGPYNELVVTVSGTYSANALVAVSGRVDVVPEPPSTTLFFLGIAAGLIFHLRRNILR